MHIKRPYWLLLGVLICLSGCSPTRLPAPDAQRPPGPIPTPPDAPAEPTFKPDVPPRFMRDDRPLHPLKEGNTLTGCPRLSSQGPRGRRCGSTRCAPTSGHRLGASWSPTPAG
jgi:hypothetical protein